MGHSERTTRGEVSSKPALDWPWAWAPAKMDSALPSGLLRPTAGRVGQGRAPGVWDLGRPLRGRVPDVAGGLEERGLPGEVAPWARVLACRTLTLKNHSTEEAALLL